MDTTDMDFHNDNLQKRDKLRDQVQVSKNLVGEMKNLRSVFKKHLDTISKEEKPDSNTEKLLKELNKEIETLKRTTRVMTNMQRHNIKRAEEYKKTVPTKVSKDEDGKIKTITAPTKEDREKQEEFSRRSTNQISDMDRRLKSTLDVLANAKEKLSELTELNKKEEKPKETTQNDSRSEEEKKEEKKEKKEKSKDTKKSEKTTPPAWLKFFGKTIFSSIGTAFKVALLPVTMGFKTITGILSGFWNSYLMSMVKTIALIGAIIYAIDWFQISAYKWGKEMGSSMEAFTSENGAWYKTMTSLTNLVESIGQFFGTQGEGSIEVTLNDIFINAGNLLMSFMEEAWRNLLAGIYNKIGWGDSNHTGESIRIDKIENENYNIDKVRPTEYQDYLDSHLYKTSRSLSGSTYELSHFNYFGDKNSKTDRDLAEGRYGHETLTKGIVDMLTLQGMDEEEARHIATTDMEVRERFVREMREFFESVKTSLGPDSTDRDVMAFLNRSRYSTSQVVREYGSDVVNEILNNVKGGEFSNIDHIENQLFEKMLQYKPKTNLERVVRGQILNRVNERIEIEKINNIPLLEYNDDEAIKLNNQLYQSSLESSQAIAQIKTPTVEEPKSNNNVLINNKNNHFTSSIVPPAVLPEYGSPNRSFRMS